MACRIEYDLRRCIIPLQASIASAPGDCPIMIWAQVEQLCYYSLSLRRACLVIFVEYLVICLLDVSKETGLEVDGLTSNSRAVVPFARGTVGFTGDDIKPGLSLWRCG